MALGYVRPARREDVGEIVRIQLATWRLAYARFIPSFALEEIDSDWLTERWSSAVVSPPSPHHLVLVAVEQPDSPQATAPTDHPPIVGFAAISPADDTVLAPGEAPLPSTVASIVDLLVEPRWGRRGHGSRLLAAAVDTWRSLGFTHAVAWTFDEDTATVGFLSSAGWERDGARRALDIEGVLVPQSRFHVSLESPEQPDQETDVAPGATKHDAAPGTTFVGPPSQPQ